MRRGRALSLTVCVLRLTRLDDLGAVQSSIMEMSLMDANVESQNVCRGCTSCKYLVTLPC